MPTSSNNATVASEIEAIIARAMAEYSAAKGIDVFAESPADNVSVEESVISEEPEPENPEIPVNSGSILVSETTSRFSSALWFDTVQSMTVTLAGLGGIGSYVAFLLSRLNIRMLNLYDDDIVEAGNLSGQLYSNNDIGGAKVSKIGNMLSNYSNYYSYNSYNERFTEHSAPTDIMICGFDNMEARRTFYNRWRQWVDSKTEEAKKDCLFIDGRLAAESFQVICIKGDDAYNMKRYEQEFLFDDSEAEQTICSYKQTTFMANMIASVMVNLFVNYCANLCDPLIPRDLPFFTEYTAETMFFKVVN